MAIDLSPQELEVYDRQIRIPGLGVEGQRKLKASKVVVAGVGGLGCPASMYLTVAGVGEILLIDKDVVELSNLNRQVLHWLDDIGRFKAISAEEKLRRLNQAVKVKGIVDEINEGSVYRLIKGADVVIDGQDNFKTRLVLNKACLALGIPFIHAAVHGLYGQLMTIIPGKGPCLQCLIPTEPPEVKPFPILGATPAVMACLQAIEAVKLIAGLGSPCIGRLIIFDGVDMRFNEVTIKRNPSCPACGSSSFKEY